MASTDTPSPSIDPGASDDPGWKAAWPFLVAVVIVVLAVGTIALFHVIKPGSERLTESAKVTRAINDYYTAKNAVNYDQFRTLSCPADLLQPSFPTADAFEKSGQASRAEHGTITITDITETAVTGSSATANMHWRYTKNPKDEVLPITLVKSSEDWKVCGAKGP
ncbi:hypothetical protein OG579_09705 [Williamsia herbipolensis]|uniref:Lumazine-binding protein n=1 Tax=Williamsia herbipolensis TaxID=1603258 RepID=A0AAU4K7G3_9NOCA|nr:hypothetical protein [Williamsia herbipolensis]